MFKKTSLSVFIIFLLTDNFCCEDALTKYPIIVFIGEDVLIIKQMIKNMNVNPPSVFFVFPRILATHQPR